MKELELVSIIVPIYNMENYLAKCIESLIMQTYSNIEILLINDGSTDSSSNICEAYEKKDYRIKTYHKSNSGVSSARNLGIRMSNGKYIVFVDSDDYVEDSYIYTLVSAFNKENVQMGIIDYYNVFQKEITTFSKDNSEIEYLNNEMVLQSIFDEKMYLGYLWNKIFLKSIIIENNIKFYENIKIWEDLVFCIEYIYSIQLSCYIHLPLYYYVQRENSTVNLKDNSKEATKILAIQKLYDLSKNKSNYFSNYIKSEFFNMLVAMFYSNKTFHEYKIDVVNVIKSDIEYLTKKHKLMFFMIKYFRSIAIGISKIKMK